MATPTNAELAIQLRRSQAALGRAQAKSQRQKKQLTEALEQQAATAEILRAISGSQTDAQPVFDAIARSAVQLCAAQFCGVFRFDGENVYFVAHNNLPPAALQELRSRFPMRPNPESPAGRAILTKAAVHIRDALSDSDFVRTFAGKIGWREVLAMPMLREGIPVGVIVVAWAASGTMQRGHEDLLVTFAEQAVIAIENVRLFNETKERLSQQTATAEVLKLISRATFDLDTVLRTLVKSAAELCEAPQAVFYRMSDAGLRPEAWHNVSEEYIAYRRLHPVPVSPKQVMGRVALTRQPVHVLDVLADPDYAAPAAQKLGEYRTVLGVPVIREGELIGVIGVFRMEVRPFLDRQIQLVATFADQAVIAIENVRLFNETREALERQTATAEILRVIASSPSNVQPVFDAIARSANRLIGGFSTGVTRVFDDALHLVAYTTTSESGDEALKSAFPMPVSSENVVTRAVRSAAPVCISDTETDPEVSSAVREVARARGFRSMLIVPLLREDVAIGMISVTRREPGEFSSHQIELLKTFADQAVIAIENVRLFKELEARNRDLSEALEQQTATAEILRVISSSPTTLDPVLEAVVKTAARLCDANNASFYLVEGDLMRKVAGHGSVPTSIEFGDTRPVTRGTVSGRAMFERRTLHIPDLLAEVDTQDPVSRDYVRREGIRTFVATPLLREGVPIGAITVYRTEVRPFSDKQIGLLKTFADQAVIAIENARLFNETNEALERQTATAEILKVISGSPTDVRPVFEAIARSAVAICNGLGANVFRYDGEMLDFAAGHNTTGGEADLMAQKFPMRPDLSQVAGRTILSKSVIRMEDALSDPDYDRRFAIAGGWRRVLGVPMLRDGNPIGAIVVRWTEAGPIPMVQEELLKTFADQAVIAIENVRLFNETKEALERQTATAEILKVISSSPADVQPVFDIIGELAERLCAADVSIVSRFDGELIQLVALHGVAEESVEAIRRIFPMRPDDEWVTARAFRNCAVIHIMDILVDAHDQQKDAAHAGGYRGCLGVPMVREGQVIGVIFVARVTPGYFADTQVELLKTFADQAVIAIENVRLFNETKEALERQTATAEILKVIASSPSDVQPVFDAIAASARRLLGGRQAVVGRRVGNTLHLAAMTSTTPAGDAALRKLFPTPLTGQGVMGKAILSREPVSIVDVETDPAYSESFREGARARGFRSTLSVPILREGEALGAINVNRPEPGSFTEHQTNLLKAFADQAVIALENVRLFNETKEALERQIATAEILRVISSSPTDTQPVFEAIVQSAVRLFETWNAGVMMREGDLIHVGAVAGPNIQDLDPVAKFFPLPFDPDKIAVARVIKERRIIEIADTEDAGEWRVVTKMARAGKYRAVTFVPLIREGDGIGTIALIRPQPGSRLTEKQLALVQTFADQAVIAIENVRLFKELQARTEALTRSVGQLTALGEVGQAISSTLDLETVLKTIVSRAVQLAGLDGGSIYEYDERAEEYHLRASENLSEEIVETLRRTPIRKNEGPVWRAGVTGQPTEIPEMLDESYQTPRREFLVAAGYRALLVVPLLRENHIIGALSVLRKAPGAFAPEVVELLKTFATQSALAIQNARLFREIAEKGRQLETASRHKSDFLASMSHELRTPLNAILGFNEMVLGEIYGEVPHDMQEPLNDIQTSGKHLLRLINNVLDLAKIEAGRMELALADYSVQDTVESVRSTLRPLAAEKGLEFLASVPDDIPLAHGDSGRITQCLMNLAGNSLKFTKAGKVEISVELNGGTLVFRVADTGMGIPPEKIGSLFTEFKQTDATIASEYGGTGLGLSISRKFVEMHGGRIWVESEPGKGATFIFEIPLRAGEGKAA